MARATRMVEQGEETLGRLIDAAFELFSKDGYNAVAAETIVKEAGVTRGALYHHFEGKRGLFEAVFVHCEEKISARILAAAGKHSDPKDRFIAGSIASLTALTDASLQRVVIEDGPRVLGWSRWRQIDAEHGLALLQQSIQKLAETGRVAGYAPDALTTLISGAINELAMWVSESEKPRASLNTAKQTLNTLLGQVVT